MENLQFIEQRDGLCSNTKIIRCVPSTIYKGWSLCVSLSWLPSTISDSSKTRNVTSQRSENMKSQKSN